MSQPLVPKNDNKDSAADVAEQVQAFLSTPLGKRYMTTLGIEYNRLHQDAEGDLSLEQKAMKIERAAGLKIAIDWLSSREALRSAGVLEKK